MRHLKKLLTVLLLMCVSLSYAQSFTVDRIKYNVLDAEAKTVEVKSNSYSGDIVIPSSVEYEGVSYSVTSIGYSAFSGCTGLTSIELPTGITSIGDWAFSGCTGITSIELPNSLTSIGYSPFENCTGHLIVNCNIPDGTPSYSNSRCLYGSKFTQITFGDKVKRIGNYAFYNSELPTIVFSENISNLEIGSYAFNGCKGITTFEIPTGVTSIESYAFSGCKTIVVRDLTPAVITTNAFDSDALIYVPTSVYKEYTSADVWKGYNGLTCEDYDDMIIHSEAQSNSSGVLEKIGDTYVRALVNLKVVGSINSYDMIILRDKTPTLRTLDLSECTVVESDKNFYNTYHTQTDDLGEYAFYGLDKLRKVVLPKNLKAIGHCAFYECRNLTKLDIPSTVKSIGQEAFYRCNSLGSIVIPEGVKVIGMDTFGFCYKLKNIALPKGLEYISTHAFRNSGLTEISFPPTLKTIEGYAFEGCSSLSEIRIPSSIQKIGSRAFDGCSNLLKVYTYTVEPTSISESTFSSFDKATLYVPKQSYWNYYWDDGWKRFLTLEQFDEPYEYFYVNKDYVLDDNTGYIEGVEGDNPDADINAGGGLVVEGEQGDDEEPNQNLGDVNVNNDGNGNGGSIIGENNLQIDNLHIKINIVGGRWYFFAFPFDIKLDKISMENGSNYVFRYYDGEERANYGKNGWKNVNGNKLNAAQGYIFQCSANDVLILDIEDIRFKKENKYQELVAHVSENLKDASWNFVGNPYLSYYDMSELDYSAPITIWDGSKYVAIRPGDDDYHFSPYEAFFVQKPESHDGLSFDGEQQMTSIQSDAKMEKQTAARMAVVSNARSKQNTRRLINLTLSCEDKSDVTRIVFNNAQSLSYEMSCDATKFETQGVIQLFSIGEDNVRYAINERPEDAGVVKLGYIAPCEGVYTLEAVRMDAPVFVKDLKTGALHDLSKGAFTFTTEGGTYTNRLQILTQDTVTGISGVNADGTLIEGEHKTYDLSGRRVEKKANGVYIIDGNKTLVK